jgi:large subunit ribosomal protein L24
MSKLSIKKDDYVMIISGQDKGKTARVAGVDKDSHRALIEGMDLHTDIRKAVKARTASDKGGLIDQPGTIDISNLMPICSTCNKPTRVGHRKEGDSNVRVCKECGAVLVTKSASTRKASKAKAETAEGKAKAAVRKREKAKEE